MANKSYELGKTIVNAVNDCSFNPIEAAVRMSKDHPTLQQNIFKMCLAYIHILSTKYANGRYDDRNEWACHLSNEMIKSLIEKDLYLPSWQQERIDKVFEEHEWD